jgi:spore coat polysaccharide biosynthesis protein SpsF
MNLGAIILCRFDSNRLPGKILKEIKGKPVIQYIFERMQTSQAIRQVVVATSIEKSDDPIADYCKDHGMACFRGDKHNVSARFSACGAAYDFDYSVRINGDNLFTDAAVLDEMVSKTHLNEYDFISNVQGRSFPYGMSIEIVRNTFYQQSLPLFTQREHFEHVTLYFYQNPEWGRQFHFMNTICPQAGGIKLAVDTQTDFEFAETLIHTMHRDHTHYHLPEIYKLWKTVHQAQEES